jgi:hypothetical protein
VLTDVRVGQSLHTHGVRATSAMPPKNETARAVERYAQNGGWG